MGTLLAFDTSTERMSIAVSARGRSWTHEGAGGVQASAAVIPAIFDLLAEAGVTLRELDAIGFGRGPGAFTGLRTACAVAQGLALGAGKPVLAIDTLQAVAQDALDGAAPQRVWAVADARMNEIYAAHYAFDGMAWTTLVSASLTTVQQLNERWHTEAPLCVAGSALAVFGAELHTGPARRVPQAAPRPAALLALAQVLWERGTVLDPAQALPLYVRDKVAQTTAERDAARAFKDRGVAAEAAR